MKSRSMYAMNQNGTEQTASYALNQNGVHGNKTECMRADCSGTEYKVTEELK